MSLGIDYRESQQKVLFCFIDYAEVFNGNPVQYSCNKRNYKQGEKTAFRMGENNSK